MPWVRRSPTEISRQQSQRRFSPLGPAIFALVGGIFAPFFIGWSIANFVGFSLLFFILGYAWRIVLGERWAEFMMSLTFGPTPPAADSAMCPSCQTPQLNEKGACARCGSKLEPLAHWRWKN